MVFQYLAKARRLGRPSRLRSPARNWYSVWRDTPRCLAVPYIVRRDCVARRAHIPLSTSASLVSPRCKLFGWDDPLLVSFDLVADAPTRCAVGDDAGDVVGPADVEGARFLIDLDAERGVHVCCKYYLHALYKLHQLQSCRQHYFYNYFAMR